LLKKDFPNAPYSDPEIFLSVVSILLFSNAFSQHDLKLWYDKPARNWNEALPVGNGRLGAMIFGGPGSIQT